MSDPTQWKRPEILNNLYFGDKFVNPPDKKIWVKTNGVLISHSDDGMTTAIAIRGNSDTVVCLAENGDLQALGKYGEVWVT